ncbi:MAG: alpha/beta fold hydrolase [Methyloligellaceae bacterium]
MSATNKPDILLLPGLDGTGELLRDLCDKLSAYRRVSVIDYPTERLLGYDQLTTLVEQRVPNGRFVILGESFSGPIAIDIAVRKKTRVAGFVLASTFAKHPMPSHFANLAKMLDLNWIPHVIVEAALLGTMGTPEIKATLARVLSDVPRDIIRIRAAQALSVDKRHMLREVA